ncbi:MAG: hypothetical protein HKN40_14370, partial [Winogradskyella sp.]|uniref:hypothetical protein n=1 Tax=Winogradskyella sp. TaxID=1883156 RepID=UPI0017D68AF7|nr:hypothetical protein [Winogradskyella sp.]
MKLKDLIKFKEWIFDNYPEIPIERLKNSDIKKYYKQQLLITDVVKPLKGMEEATIIDYCNEVKEMFEIPSHSNN